MSLEKLIEDKWHEDDQSGKSIEGRKADEEVTKAKPNPFPQWTVIEKALEEARPTLPYDLIVKRDNPLPPSTIKD